MRRHLYLVYGATALISLAAVACDDPGVAGDGGPDSGDTTMPTTAGTGTGGPTGGDSQGQTTQEQPSGGLNGETTGGDVATGTTVGSTGTDTGTATGATSTTGGANTTGTTTGTTGTTDTTGGGGGNPALVNPGPGDSMFVGANFWNIDWEGSEGYFTAGVDFATTTNPWRADFLQDLAPYGVLRFMDWNQINFEDNEQATWATRKQKTATQTEPVAFEWQIDLCNRTQTDYWVNIPHQASPAYWTQLAELIHTQLDPQLRVYVEWSNETWNNIFPQAAYATSQGNALGLAGTNPAASYTVHESVRVFEAFEQVFGKDSPRLVKVLPGMAAWSGVCDALMLALADTQINPKGTMPDAFAIAPYFGGTSIAVLEEEVDVAVAHTQANAACAAKAGLPLIAYEGGQDSFAAGGPGCAALQHDPAMYDLYTEYLDGLAQSLKGPYVQYTHSGICWGLVENTGDSLDISPKYRAVVDWLAAHP